MSLQQKRLAWKYFYVIWVFLSEIVHVEVASEYYFLICFLLVVNNALIFLMHFELKRLKFTVDILFERFEIESSVS